MSVMDRLLRSDMVVVEVVIEGVGGGNVGVHEIGVRLSPGRDKARDQTQAKHLLSRLLKINHMKEGKNVKKLLTAFLTMVSPVLRQPSAGMGLLFIMVYLPQEIQTGGFRVLKGMIMNKYSFLLN